MNDVGRYSAARILEIRIRLLGAWKYNALVKRKEKVIVIQNLGGMVTVNGKYIGAVEDAARKILREHGWEPGMWKLEVYYGRRKSTST